MRHTRHVLTLAFLSGLPWMGATLFLLFFGEYSKLVWTTVLILAFWAWVTLLYLLFEGITRPLQVVSSLLSGLKEGDPTVKAKAQYSNDPLDEILQEINGLAGSLQAHRMGAEEAQRLLLKLIDRIEVAVYAFDRDDKLRMTNRAGAELFARKADSLVDKTLEELGLEAAMASNSGRVVPIAFPVRSSRWLVKRSAFREDGLPHQLLLLSDVGEPLREEERTAWKRLIRVMGHELNNSMTPIKSLADSMKKRLAREEVDDEERKAMMEGLQVIGDRVDNLNRFVEEYSRIAKLPEPDRKPIDLKPFLQRVAAMETRLAVKVEEGSECELHADAVQLEQLLINLLKNAVDAVDLEQGMVSLGWEVHEKNVAIRVRDNGSGISNTDNLFIPFFTTKANGTGIGLTLSRQIAEAHEGTLEVRNRNDGAGCEAILVLSLQATV